MAINRSENKCRVTRLFGTGSTVGLVEPQVNMKVRRGIDDRWIVGLDSGNFQVSLALGSGGVVKDKAYPHELEIDAVQASGFGWPTANGDTTFGHVGGIYTAGKSPTIPGSGMVYMGGNGATTLFSRQPDD